MNSEESRESSDVNNLSAIHAGLLSVSALPKTSSIPGWNLEQGRQHTEAYKLWTKLFLKPLCGYHIIASG